MAALVALPLFLLVHANPAQAQAYRGLVGQGWTYMEAGNFRKAEEAFKAAFETQEGKNAAEVYYAVAALWWERRNAMAAYMWLSDAEKASRSSFSWVPGPDSVWDQRIAKRREFIERHFSAIRLRAPSRGAPLPPLADPPSTDPLLREFTDRLPVVIQEGVAEKVAVQWVLLPNGRYWIGDAVVDLQGGELDASKAEAWELPKDSGKLRKSYDERAAAIAAGRSPAAEYLAAKEQEADATAAAAEQARVEEQKAAAAEAERAALAAEELEERERREAAELVERERREAAELAERERREAAELAERAERASREAADKAERERLEAEKVAARERAEAEKAAAREQSEAAKAAAREREEAAKAAAREREEAEKAAAREREASERQAREGSDAARREQERLAAEDRKIAEAAAAREREEEERLEEERRQAEWGEAQARMREEQEKEKEAERLRREQLRKAKGTASTVTDEVFTRRRLLMTGGIGGATVGRLTATGSESEVAWAAQAELAYVVPLKGALGLPIGLSWANLPVSGCSHRQTRANGVSLHVGPRLARNLTGRLWLTGRIGGHVGGAITLPVAEARNQCATASLDADGVAYGARVTADSGGTARLSLGELGWSGWAVLMGPDADIGILGAPGSGKGYLGVSFFVRYDQVVPVIGTSVYHFRAEEPSDSFELDTLTLNSFSSRVSMARFQFGLRGQMLF